ncbi:AraC-type DNA-binding protein [Ekhidna lutea]|uniref:AraC-type DNA-binding protein n=1 Tax=Ekhidna lutea TaxID=447679 RepID=A0A239KA04_EKHLU|nr:AraC family transcriptional regulator [Ekhidna lutea]SNT15276.1 AraC-type DNA-binding protein [Ekhidna lutea]
MIAIGLTLLGVALIWYTRYRPKQQSDEQNGLDEEELKAIYNKTIELIEAEQYFLNKSLKISDLAKELSCNERYVSRAINKFSSGNFNKFINSFRIEHSKELLTGGKFDHYTIEAIADESGFSNKVSFYNAFKGDTGMSPTQYRALKQAK